MNQGLAVVLPLLLFAMLDLIIVSNVYKYKNNMTERTIFLAMSAANFVQQLCGAVSYLFDYQIISAPAAAQYVLYLCMFTGMTVTGFEWLMYLRIMLVGKQDLSKGSKMLLQIPVIVIFLMTAVSPWTHWILWIDADGVYQRGTLYFMQFTCSYIYVVLAIASLVFYRKRRASAYTKKVYGYFILFILPAVLGSVLQLTVFSGGYSMIGMSLAVIFLYLDLYVDKMNENQRLQLEAKERERHLQEVMQLNRSLEEAAAEKENQLDITGGLSNAYMVCSCYNLKTKEIIHVKELPEVHELLKDCHEAGEAFDKFISSGVASEDREAMKEFVRLETLPERLKDKNVLSIEFRKLFPKQGWNRASWIAASRDEGGNAYKFLYAVEDITDSVLERKRQEALILASNTDALTGLMNRRAYGAELDSVNIIPDDLVYIAFDVNGLKYANDHLGHAAGDELLIGAADCLQKAFGSYGNVFRIGGDEFAAILHISMEELEKTENVFKSLVDHWSGKLVGELHIAIGYAAGVQDRGCENLQQMSVLADKRMYADKAEYYRQSGTDRRDYGAL